MKNRLLFLFFVLFALPLQAQQNPPQDDYIEIIKEIKNNNYSILVMDSDSIPLYRGTLSSLEPRKRDGAFSFFYPSGKVYATGMYRNNFPAGPWVFYDTAMQVQHTLNYDDAMVFMKDTLAVLPFDSLYAKKFKKKEKNLIDEEGSFRVIDIEPKLEVDMNRVFLGNNQDIATILPDNNQESDSSKIGIHVENDSGHRTIVYPGIKSSNFNDYWNSVLIVPAYNQVMDLPKFASVEFIIDYQGKVRHPRITRSGGPEINMEIFRILAHLPDWEPARLNNIPVSSRINKSLFFNTDFYYDQDDYFTCEEKMDSLIDETSGDVYFIVENMPLFNGGDPAVEFRKFIAQNLMYPSEAIKNGISGRVIVQFTVYPDGSVHNAIVVRGVDPYLNAEAIRVITSSPLWTPGRQRGKPVAVLFTFPINFVLDNANPSH